MIVEIDEPALRLPDTGPREGVHLSSIIRCIAQETGIIKLELLEDIMLVDKAREITDPVAILRILMGLGWEMVYIPMIQDAIGHPGEVEVDGIRMNPDSEGMSVILTSTDKGATFKRRLRRIVHEVKCTYKSINTVGDLMDPKKSRKNWMYLAQLMAYCRAKKTLHGWLHVLFVDGDYTWPMRPAIRIYKVTFLQEELDENWSLMTDYRDHRLQIEGI